MNLNIIILNILNIMKRQKIEFYLSIQKIDN